MTEISFDGDMFAWVFFFFFLVAKFKEFEERLINESIEVCVYIIIVIYLDFLICRISIGGAES